MRKRKLGAEPGFFFVRPQRESGPCVTEARSGDAKMMKARNGGAGQAQGAPSSAAGLRGRGSHGDTRTTRRAPSRVGPFPFASQQSESAGRTADRPTARYSSSASRWSRDGSTAGSSDSCARPRIGSAAGMLRSHSATCLRYPRAHLHPLPYPELACRTRAGYPPPWRREYPRPHIPRAAQWCAEKEHWTLTTLEKLQAAQAKIEEAARLLNTTDYGIIAERADELLVELDQAITEEETA